MGKSLRSKVKQRYKRAKRHLIDGTLHTDRINSLNENVKKLQQGLSIGGPRPKNAFLYPCDHEAIFPQKELSTPIDFRSENLPLSGYCVTGCRRNFTDEEKLELNLVVRCKDGLLPSEKKSLLEEQTSHRQYLEGLGDEEMVMMSNNENNGAVDENDLICSMQTISLEKSSKKAGISEAESLRDIKKHQDKIGGRTKKIVEIPKIQNKLKAKSRQMTKSKNV